MRHLELIRVEVWSVEPGPRCLYVYSKVVVHPNRIMLMRIMGPDYRAQFECRASGYYATAKLQPGTFPEETRLSAPSTSAGQTNRIGVHWWVTRSQHDALTECVV